ncbi:erythromycin esterase family protein [Amycolatopsis anabasis]|uniref:erythromycin esterase family protein n=1 Tax=Amycolatopsis anabasis TaxID=1840409 RepID=UPI00131D0E7B|nr:erythromycin esterase family protein [Amycolatopsis anabasis]
METTTAVRGWIGEHATPLTLDPAAPPDDLHPLRDRVRDATVVALAASVRTSHELSVLAHRMLRFLVEDQGFRSLALEGDDDLSVRLDEHVTTGEGDPRDLLARARSFYRTAEILDVVRWIRAYNAGHPADPVRFALADRPARGPANPLAEIERGLAENTIRWHERTGHKIVYWGGIAHVAHGPARNVGPGLTHRNAGSYLRERFGAGFVPIGLTFHHGELPYPVPAPPEDFADAVLGAAGLDAYLLDLRADAPEPVRAWFDAPAKTRLIGPTFDAAHNADYRLSGGSLAEWFACLAHVREVTPVRLLG